MVQIPSVLLMPAFSRPPPQFLRVFININTVQKTRLLLLYNCYHCRETSYLIKDCPHCLSIQQLMAEQREELIEDLIAFKNIVVAEELEPLVKEDFV